ncbi:TetR family transcriptional regulator [Burkholderia sp. Ac-20384]|uniref:TetR/AcrR family transcriptional regulator n=1 Tax=Burkholderia sp. Ac-20384 TaxID=2703902 RepID=UPI00197FEF25|nr:TetR/AcrR family transcriptional regulator [Burkholderia sp. Ac-20384]MBN3823775.1 TetR family transcriptional regulator [Burkholderia sp. Ac-20384]
MANAAPNKRGIETRLKLLAAGVSEFHVNGFNGVGVDQIAKTAGVPKGSFYNLFESKEAFAAEVIDQYFQSGQSRLNEFFGNKDLSPLDRLRGYFHELISHYIKLGFRRGCMLGNLTLEAADQSDIMRDRLAQNLRLWSATLASAIEEAQQRGEVTNRILPSTLADFTLNCWEGALLRMKAEKSIAPLEQACDVIFRVILV